MNIMKIQNSLKNFDQIEVHLKKFTGNFQKRKIENGKTKMEVIEEKTTEIPKTSIKTIEWRTLGKNWLWIFWYKQNQNRRKNWTKKKIKNNNPNINSASHLRTFFIHNKSKNNKKYFQGKYAVKKVDHEFSEIQGTKIKRKKKLNEKVQK